MMNTRAPGGANKNMNDDLMYCLHDIHLISLFSIVGLSACVVIEIGFRVDLMPFRGFQK